MLSLSLAETPEDIITDDTKRGKIALLSQYLAIPSLHSADLAMPYYLVLIYARAPYLSHYPMADPDRSPSPLRTRAILVRHHSPYAQFWLV